jgi:hypothetical protein
VLRIFCQIGHRLVDMDYGAMRVAPDDLDLLGRSFRQLDYARGDVGGAFVEVVGKITDRCGACLVFFTISSTLSALRAKTAEGTTAALSGEQSRLQISERLADRARTKDNNFEPHRH